MNMVLAAIGYSAMGIVIWLALGGIIYWSLNKHYGKRQVRHSQYEPIVNSRPAWTEIIETLAIFPVLVLSAIFVLFAGIKIPQTQ